MPLEKTRERTKVTSHLGMSSAWLRSKIGLPSFVSHASGLYSLTMMHAIASRTAEAFFSGLFYSASPLQHELAPFSATLPDQVFAGQRSYTMTTMDGAFGHSSYRGSVLGLMLTFMKQLPQPYILVLPSLVHWARSLTFNPVPMTNANKAKEYGLGAAVLACTIVSLLASMLCMSWFCRMEKRFRHRYVVLKDSKRHK